MKKIIAICFLSLFLFSACGQETPEQRGDLTIENILTEPDGETISLSHAKYNGLLQKYVNARGLVNYAAWQANSEDTEALRDYLSGLGQIDPRNLDHNEKLAYFINAYNAHLLQAVLEFYPISSIEDVNTDEFNIWEDYPLMIQNLSLSFNDIEHKILRKMSEPRIHFVIHYASIGGAEVSVNAYSGSHLEQQMEDRTVYFFKSLRNFRPTISTKTAGLHMLFQWYPEDFGGTEEAILEYIQPYLVIEREKALLDDPELTVEYINYNWDLNEWIPEEEEDGPVKFQTVPKEG